MVKFVQEPARDIPVKDEVDILVVGGGPSGIMAARAAAALEIPCKAATYMIMQYPVSAQMQIKEIPIIAQN